MSEKDYDLVLVDGSSYLHRAFHGYPHMDNGEIPTNAIYGVVTLLRSTLNNFKFKHFAVAFDAPGKNFRHVLYPEYKANRPPKPEELTLQVEPLHEVVKAMGLPLLCVPDVEADDVIGTLADQASQQGMSVLICTGDKDMAQLVNDRVILTNTMTKTFTDEEAVHRKYGIPPNLIIDYLALTGDKVDNIPGVPGIGDKTATMLLQAVGSVKTIYDHLDTIVSMPIRNRYQLVQTLIDNRDKLELSYELATIKLDLELDCAPDSLNPTEPDYPKLAKLFQWLKFNSFLSEMPAHVISSLNVSEQASASLAICPDNTEIIDRIFNDVVVVSTAEESLAMMKSNVVHDHKSVFHLRPKEGLPIGWTKSFVSWLAYRTVGTIVLPARFDDNVLDIDYQHILPPLGYKEIAVYGKDKLLRYENCTPSSINTDEIYKFLEEQGDGYPRSESNDCLDILGEFNNIISK